MLPQMESATETYNRDFANYYDRITGHKDYQAEIDTLANFLRQTVKHPQPRLLDVGCGTGNHAALLAAKGYDITAIDLSPDMIRIADSKGSNVNFKSGDIAEMAETGFHFSYSLFNVINCLGTMDDLIAFFKEVFVRLADGGVFLVESWNPVAVIAAPPEVVERTYEYADEVIIRKVTPASDFLHQRLDLQYDIDVYDTGERPQKLKSFSVTHHLVLFTPLEIDFCLQRAAFRNIKVFTALPELAPAAADDRMLAFTCEK